MRLAHEHFARAVELSGPDNPTHGSFLPAHLLLENGQIERALSIFDQLVARNPLGARNVMQAATARIVMGTDLERALALLKRVLELDPSNPDASFLHSRVQRLLGRDEVALAELLDSRMPAETRSAIRAAYASGGWPAVDSLLVDYQRTRGPIVDGCASGAVGGATHLRLLAGDAAGALDCFEAGYRAGGVNIFIHPGVSYLWDPLRSEPRFQAILAAVNLSEEPRKRVDQYRECAGPSPSLVRCRELKPHTRLAVAE